MAAASLALCASFAPQVTAQTIRTDEEVLFLPTPAYRVGAKGDWQLEIRARIFERDERPITLAALAPIRQIFGLDHLADDEEKIFRERARLFLVDSKENKRIPIQVGGKLLSMQRSSEGGFGVLRHVIADDDALRNASGLPPRWLAIRAVLGQKDKRAFVGAISLVEPQGVTIVSDIDDTIKVTNVLDRREMARNSFARQYKAVAGMGDVYSGWLKATPGIAFHYVSASPWQLYEPLETFRKAGGFPPGTFHLREFAFKHAKTFAGADSSIQHKTSELEKLAKNYPERKFVLIGDSGERDPEIYGEVARRFPKQIVRIAIRDVTNEAAETPRYAKAFASVQAKWSIFREARELGETPL